MKIIIYDIVSYSKIKSFICTTLKNQLKPFLLIKHYEQKKTIVTTGLTFLYSYRHENEVGEVTLCKIYMLGENANFL